MRCPLTVIPVLGPREGHTFCRDDCHALIQLACTSASSLVSAEVLRGHSAALIRASSAAPASPRFSPATLGADAARLSDSV
jgi:hypothetical protein